MTPPRPEFPRSLPEFIERFPDDESCFRFLLECRWPGGAFRCPRCGHDAGYRWGAQKLAAWKLRLRFKTRPPTGYIVRVTYDYLAAESLAIVQGANGVTKLVFGTAPGNGKKLTAKYRTTPFHGLRVTWRPGTLDQQPIEGFTDLEQSRNPKEQVLARNVGNTYSTDGREVDDLRVGISAPRGMIQYKDDGGTNAITVRVRVEYRKQGETTWTVLPSHSGNSFELIGERASTMRWENHARNFAGSRNAGGTALR